MCNTKVYIYCTIDNLSCQLYDKRRIMKKFCIISLVLIASIIGIVFIVASLTSNDKFIYKNYTSNEKEIYAIVIDVEDREVEISQSVDDNIHVEYYESEKEFYNLSINDNNEFIISIAYNKSWLDYIGKKPNENYRKIHLQVPNNLLNSIQITTTNEDIKLNNVSFTESIALNTNGGNVEFDNIFVGKQINLIAKNGSITGTIKGDWSDFSISCKIKKGNCNLPTYKDGGTKMLIADCNNGNININFI